MQNTTTSCPKVEKCPIFQKGVLMSEKTGESYKNIYCLTDRHNICKRFLAAQLTKKPIPVQVLPNTVISAEEIVKRIDSGFYDIFNK